MAIYYGLFELSVTLEQWVHNFYYAMTLMLMIEMVLIVQTPD